MTPSSARRSGMFIGGSGCGFDCFGTFFGDDFGLFFG